MSILKTNVTHAFFPYVPDDAPGAESANLTVDLMNLAATVLAAKGIDVENNMQDVAWFIAGTGLSIAAIKDRPEEPQSDPEVQAAASRHYLRKLQTEALKACQTAHAVVWGEEIK